MIIGIGTDLCQISRMERLLKDDRFLQRYFTTEEQQHIRGRAAGAAASAAACFAAKEAFVKALGSGFSGIAPKEVSVVHDAAGAPGYLLRGEALARAQARGVVRTDLSLSHERDLAVAFAVLEGTAP